MKIKKNTLARFFSIYPADTLIRRGLLDAIVPTKQVSDNLPEGGVICIQSTPDKLYFLLFGLIRQQLRLHVNLKAELVVVRSINGSLGTGWMAAFKRWSVLAWWWSSQWERTYGPVMDGVAYRCAALFQPYDDLRDWLKSKELWEELKSQLEDFNLEVEGIEVGDLIVDSYLRFRPSPKFDVNDHFVRILVWQVLRDVRQGARYFKATNPKFYLCSYSSYIEHGVTARVAMKHGIPVFSFANLSVFGKGLSSQDPYTTVDSSCFRVDFESLDRQNDRLEEARAKLKVRLSGGIDPATSYMRQSAYGSSEVLLPTNMNGAVVIFLHDFFDSPHVFADLIFCDFWRWICFTIEALQENGTTFYLKPHPNQISQNFAVLEELRAKYPNVNWLSPGVSNVQLVDAGMICGVTMYGTIAHELAYLKIPSIGCARHPHHSFDFCRTAKTREEYKAMLESPGVLPGDKNEIQKQALMFYYMHNLHGSEDEIALRQAFHSLWFECDINNGQDNDVMNALLNLRDQPAFKAYVNNLAKICLVNQC
jgi:hypothetical protein